MQIHDAGKLTTALACLIFFSCTPSRMEQIDRLLKPYCGAVPGIAVMIIDNGAPALIRTCGQASLEKDDLLEVGPGTNFRLASITKQFTAMCIMMLQEQGQLNYEAKLTDIFPEFPDYGRQITIRNILNHTSGLIDYEDLIPDTATIQVLDRDVLAMMMSVDSTYFPPGSAYSYSNSGYAVLAMIIEKNSGQTFATFLKENIFLPLGMKNTVAYENGISTVPNRAFGYHVNGDSIEFSDQSITSAVLGDGGIYTSLDDILKWDQALYGEKLVTRETLEEAFTPVLENYGFGWRIDEFKGHRRVHHAGSTSGFRNFYQRFIDDKISVIVLSNRREPKVDDVGEKIAALYLGGL